MQTQKVFEHVFIWMISYFPGYQYIGNGTLNAAKPVDEFVP